MLSPLYALIGSHFGNAAQYGAAALSHLQFNDGLELYLLPGRTVDYWQTVGQVHEVSGQADEHTKQSFENLHILGFTNAPVDIVNGNTDAAAGFTISSEPSSKNCNVIFDRDGEVFSHQAPLIKSYLTTQILTHRYRQPVFGAYLYRQARFSDT